MKNLKTIIFSLLVALSFYNCSDDDSAFSGADNYISSFELKQGDEVIKATISSDGQVNINIPENTSLDGAVATVAISENATINPNPATITNWNEDQSFELISHNGSKKTYQYKVIRSGISQDGDIVLLTQSDVDSIGALKITAINGSLIIGASKGEDEITSLAALTSIKSIRKNLSIYKTYVAEDLKGLENLESVGSFIIDNNETVKLVQLPKLKSAVTGFSINQSSVEKLIFPELTSIDKAFKIQNSPDIKELSFPKLKQVVESLTIEGAYSGSDKLKAIEFPSLEKIGASLNISRWSEVIKIDVPVLKSVIGFSASSLDKTESISAPKLEAMYGALSLASCDVLKSVNFETLKTIPGGLSIQNSGLVNFDGFKSLETVGKELFLYGLPSLKSSKGLKNLKTVQGRVYINEWPLLEDDIEGLSFLNQVDGEIVISQIAFKKFSGFSLSKIEKLSIFNSNLATIEEIDVRNIDITSLQLTKISSPFVLKGPDVCDYDVTWEECNFAKVEGFKEIKKLTFSWSTTNSKEIIVNVNKVQEQLSVSAYGLDKISFPNLTEVTGYFYITSGSKVFNAPVLKKVGKAKADAASMNKFTLPMLESVDGDFIIESGTYNNPDKLTEIDMPKLTSINGTLDVSGFSNYYGNKTLTNLNGFSALKKVKAIKVVYNFALTDFSGLKNAISSISASGWNVSGNSYNPSFQDMVDGKYVK